MPPGLDEMRAYRPTRPCGLSGPPNLTGFQYAGLTCDVILGYIIFAIPGGFLR